MATARQRAASALVEIFGSTFLRAMTEPARIELVRVLLLHGPLDVGELAGHVPQERSVVSRHLRALEQAGLVAATRRRARSPAARELVRRRGGRPRPDRDRRVLPRTGRGGDRRGPRGARGGAAPPA